MDTRTNNTFHHNLDISNTSFSAALWGWMLANGVVSGHTKEPYSLMRLRLALFYGQAKPGSVIWKFAEKFVKQINEEAPALTEAL